MPRKKKTTEEVKEVQTLEQATIVEVIETPAVEETKEVKTTITKEEYLAEIGKFLSKDNWIKFAKTGAKSNYDFCKYSTLVLFNIIERNNHKRISPEERILIAKILKGIYICQKEKQAKKIVDIKKMKAIELAIGKTERLDQDFVNRLLASIKL